MKTINLLLAVSLISVACSAGSEEGPPGGADPSAVEVSISAFRFDPNPLEIARGTTVTWTNEDNIDHTVTSGKQQTGRVPGVDEGEEAAPDGTFDGALPQAGETFTFTFDDPGTFDYYCAIHAGMTGTVVVS